MSDRMAQIEETLTQIFRQVFRNPNIVVEPTSTSKTIAGWDSFRWVEILVALEAAYSIELEGPEIDDVQSVGDLARLIAAKTAA